MQKSEQIKRTREFDEMSTTRGRGRGADKKAKTAEVGKASDEGKDKDTVKVTDEAKEKEMTARAKALLDDIYEDKEVDPIECAKAQLFLGFNSRAKITNLDKEFNKFKDSYELKIDEIDDKFESIEERLTNLELRNIELELMAVARELVVRKLPLHSDATEEKETRDQTFQQLDTFFKAIKLDLQPYEFPEFHRLPPKKDIPVDQKKPPIVLIRFPFIKHVRMFFKCLAMESSKTQFKEVSVENAVPKALRVPYDAANKKGKELRDSGWQTKVEIAKSGKVILSTKKKGSKIWATVPY